MQLIINIDVWCNNTTYWYNIPAYTTKEMQELEYFHKKKEYKNTSAADACVVLLMLLVEEEEECWCGGRVGSKGGKWCRV